MQHHWRNGRRVSDRIWSNFGRNHRLQQAERYLPMSTSPRNDCAAWIAVPVPKSHFCYRLSMLYICIPGE